MSKDISYKAWILVDPETKKEYVRVHRYTNPGKHGEFKVDILRASFEDLFATDIKDFYDK